MRQINFAGKKSSSGHKGPKIFLKIVIILFYLNFLCSGSSAMLDLKIAPSLVSNNGTDKVKFSWYVDPGFEIAEYTIKISKENSVIFSNRYSVNDTMPGGSYPLIGSYVWTVPKDQALGLYIATLELGSRYDLPPTLYSEPFVIADEGEVARLRAEGASVLTEEARSRAIKAEAQRMAKQEAEAQRMAEQQEAEAQKMAKQEVEAQRMAEQEVETQRMAEQQDEAQRMAKQEFPYISGVLSILITFITVFVYLRQRGGRNG